MKRMQWVVFAALALAGCDSELTHPDLLIQKGLPEGLLLRIEVHPDRVNPHASFLAVFEATNATSDTLEVTTPSGCLVVPAVYRGGERVPFAGSGAACPGVVTTHSFPPGETAVRSWEMRAELAATEPGAPDGLPAPSGIYLVRAEFEFTNESGDRPGAGAFLRVR